MGRVRALGYPTNYEPGDSRKSSWSLQKGVSGLQGRENSTLRSKKSSTSKANVVPPERNTTPVTTLVPWSKATRAATWFRANVVAILRGNAG